MWFFSVDLLKVHLNREHMTCQVCGPNKKFAYYRDVFVLNKHWEFSHHPCRNELCAAEGIFLHVFSTEAELDYHDHKSHQRMAPPAKGKGKKGKRKLDASSLLGLNDNVPEEAVSKE